MASKKFSKKIKKSKKIKRTTKRSNLRKRKFRRGGTLFTKTKTPTPTELTSVQSSDNNQYKEGVVIDLLPFIKKLHNITTDDSVKNLYYVITKYIKNVNENKSSVVLVSIDKNSMKNTRSLIEESSIYSQLLTKKSEVLKLENDIKIIKMKNNDIVTKTKVLSFFEKYEQKGGSTEDYDSGIVNNTKKSNGYYDYLDNIEELKILEKQKKIKNTEINQKKSNIQILKDEIERCFNSNSSFEDNDKRELEQLFNNANTENKEETNKLIKKIKDVIIPLIKSELESREAQIKKTEAQIAELKKEIESINSQIAKLKTENPLLQPEIEKIEKVEKDNSLFPSITKTINVEILNNYIIRKIQNNDNINYIYAVGNDILYNDEIYIINHINKSYFTSAKTYDIVQKNSPVFYTPVINTDLKEGCIITQLSDENAKKILNNIK